MTEHPGEHTTEPVRHSSEEFHAIELQERWLDENPGRTADDYSAWKMANSSSSSNNPTSVFDAWARGVGRDVAAQEERSAEDLRLAQVIADAEAHAAGWAHGKALFSDAPHTQVWTSLAEPDLSRLRTTLGVAPSDAVPGLADAQAEARRWARSLVSLCSITSQTADRAIAATDMANRSTNGIEPARQEYQIAFASLMDAVTRWQDVTADTANPDVDTLATAASDVVKALQAMLLVHTKLETAYTHFNDPIPDTIGVGVRLRLAAVSGEVARQFASRGANPQASLMYDRIGEDPRRDTDRTMWGADILTGLQGNPRTLSDLITRQMRSMAVDPSLTRNARDELVNILKSKQLPALDDAMKRWQAAFDPAAPGLAGMSEATNSLMFTLSAYRDALARANLSLVDLITLASPIDALQEYLQEVLQRLVPAPPPVTTSSGASSSGSGASSGTSTGRQQ